jgi:signal transduction histidine kinase
MRALLPTNEAARLATLAETGALDTPPEPAFDGLTALAAQICQAPIALVSLLDTDRQWFKSRCGLSMTETPRAMAICAHAILSEQTLVIPDTHLDPRTADNPLVTGEPHIRFYAGVPLVQPNGTVLGTLCVIDTQPRSLSDSQLQALNTLGLQASSQLTLRRAQNLATTVQEAKNEFLRSVSHNVRTPLTAIRGFAEILSEANTDADRREALEVILRNERALTSAIGDLIDLASLDPDSNQSPTYVDLSILANTIRSRCGTSTAESQPPLSVSAVPTHPAVVDEACLTLIARVLTDNALRHSPNGPVRTTLSSTPAAIVVSVQDSGPGMPEDVAHELTTQAHASPLVSGTAAQAQILGVGLSLVAQTTAKLHGTITVHAAPTGTTITVAVPNQAAANVRKRAA